LSELRRAFEIKTVSVTPRTCSHVLIVGAPHSGRTTLAKSFAQYYNLVYISSMALISNEVRKDSITGRKIKEAFLKHELVDEFTIQKLIEERINKTDCLMQGFVLEGYPKTQ
jgi:adenylate kinase family enzyme